MGNYPAEALRDAFWAIFEVHIASETITKAQNVFLVEKLQSNMIKNVIQDALLKKLASLFFGCLVRESNPRRYDMTFGIRA